MSQGAPAAGAEREGLPGWVAFCVEHIEAIVREIGPRPSASQAELRAQRYLAALLRPLADDVVLEEFSVAPRAFMGFVPLAGGLLLLAVGVIAWLPALAFGFVALAVGLLVGVLILYRPLTDPFFPKARSHNLVATLRPRGPVERVLVLGGHCDSAWEWRWHYRGRAPLVAIAGGAVLGAGVGLVASLGAWVAPGTALATGLCWAFAAFSPCFALVMGFTDFGRVSPGANDDLSGVLVGVALAGMLGEPGERPERTEIRILCSGSEECGVRGARAWVDRHREELSRTPSLYVALDTFRDLEHMAVYDRDRSGTLRHDPQAADLLQQAAREAGYELPFRSLPLGGSDAIAFTEAGLPAVALIAMDPAPPRWYHTRLDTPELLEPACIEAALRVMRQLVRRVDAAPGPRSERAGPGA